MINYTEKWKQRVNFKQISYNDFVSLDVKNAIFSRKVDGMLGAFVYQHGKESFFQTTKGRTITDLPAITEYEVMLRRLKIKSAVIIGELVAQRADQILPFNLTQSIVKKSYKPEYKDLVHHYAVDVYSIDGREYNYDQALRFLFKNIGRGFLHVHIPKTRRGDLEVFRKMFEEIKGVPGYDGVIVRGFGKHNYKVKFVETVDCVVIAMGNTEMKTWSRGEISYLRTAFVDKDGLFRTSSKVGTGFTSALRRFFFTYAMKNKLYVENGDVFLKPRLIIEFKYFRFRLTNTPAYRFTKNKYLYLGEKKSVTFSNPSFVRVRTDKKVNKYDLRLEQVPEFEY